MAPKKTPQKSYTITTEKVRAKHIRTIYGPSPDDLGSNTGRVSIRRRGSESRRPRLTNQDGKPFTEGRIDRVDRGS